MNDESSITRRGFLCRAAAAAIVVGGRWPVVRAATPATTSRQRTTDDEPPTTVYSWHNAQQRGIVPMTWQPMQATGSALIMVRPMPGAFSAPPAEIVAHGPRNIDRWRGWMQRYFKRFHPAPVRIVLDDEDRNISYWSLCRGLPTGERRVAIFRNIWQDKAAYAKLPESVKRYEPKDFASHAGRDAIIAWQDFAKQMKADALRKVVYEPAVEVFGEDVAVSNYNDADFDFPVYDLNGWPRTRAIMGNESSPSCYLRTGGHRYSGLDKPVIWNSFIDALNVVRSCLNTKLSVAPWVSLPSYQQGKVDVRQVRRLWVEMIGHMKAAGVRTFLYWNPSNRAMAGDNALAAQTFAAETGAIARGPFEAIPLDADQVRTGDKVTRYADWAGGHHD